MESNKDLQKKRGGGGARCVMTRQERSKCDVDLNAVVPSRSTRRLNSRVPSADLSDSEGRSSFVFFLVPAVNLAGNLNMTGTETISSEWRKKC